MNGQHTFAILKLPAYFLGLRKKSPNETKTPAEVVVCFLTYFFLLLTRDNLSSPLLVNAEGNCNYIVFHNANWEPDTSRNTIHPQNVGDINVGSKKNKAYSFFVSLV